MSALLTPPVPAAASDRVSCWFCRVHATETWRDAVDTTDLFPMCPTHARHVRASLAFRAAGNHIAADSADRIVGIDTRPNFTHWIDPAK